MAYSSSVFYIDFELGDDSNRTDLTSCIASNPSGTVTRISKTAHGLSTGAIVDLTSFDSWLNGTWKITVISTSTFDLDGAIWQATVDNTGTEAPRGGSSWSDSVVATLADNTNWQQLFLFFTPTENGVITVEALAEYVSGNTNVYIDQINVTQ